MIFISFLWQFVSLIPTYKFIVPKIKEDKPFIVVDVHEIDPNYEYSNFIFSLSNSTPKVESYMNKISQDVGLINFEFEEGTSPERVTKPIAKQGIPTFLVEVSIQDTTKEKQKTADKLIKSLDQLEP